MQFEELTSQFLPRIVDDIIFYFAYVPHRLRLKMFPSWPSLLLILCCSLVDENRAMSNSSEFTTLSPRTSNSSPRKLQITLALMGMRYPGRGPPTKLYRVGSAFIMALEDSNRMSSRLELSYTLHDSACDPRKSVGGLVDVVRDYGIYGVIGPACSAAAISLAYLAAHWNIPVIGYT